MCEIRRRGRNTAYGYIVITITESNAIDITDTAQDTMCGFLFRSPAFGTGVAVRRSNGLDLL